MKVLAIAGALALAGCSTTPLAPPTAAAAFFINMTKLCGKSFSGKLANKMKDGSILVPRQAS